MPFSCVSERKAAGVYPLTAEERQQEEDVQWALHDPEVLANYTGEFVVPVDGALLPTEKPSNRCSKKRPA